METLETLEKKLTTIIKKDKKNWVNLYLMLDNIQTNELWKPAYKSFTAWLKTFCINNKIAESIIWREKKAGKVYNAYAQYQLSQGKEVIPIEKANIGVESLVLIDEISKGDAFKRNNLIEQTLNSRNTVKDLREIARVSRAEKKITAIKNKQKLNTDIISGITASDVVCILNNPKWLDELNPRDKKVKLFKSFVEKDRYKVYTEFPVISAGTKGMRRIDALIVENLTSIYTWKLVFHGIEIKVNKYDLIKDKKYTEYADFVDYMWLAVPDDLIEIAEENKFDKCGIINIKDSKAIIISKADLLKPLLKPEMMNTLILKLLN